MKTEDLSQLTDWQKEFLQKWVEMANNRGWEKGSPEEWAEILKYPLNKLYDVYADWEDFEADLEYWTETIDWASSIHREEVSIGAQEETIIMSDGQVVFVHPEGISGFLEDNC